MDQLDTISFKEMIEWINSGNTFSLSFVTYDKKREKGGEWIEIKCAQKHMSTHSESTDQVRELHPVSSYQCNPKHAKNSTVNIKLLNGSIRKVHFRLIRIFNKKTVL